jgi:hypothetical protein
MGIDPKRATQAAGPNGFSADRQPWTVLFIGAHGRVIPFKRLKALVALGAAAFALCLAAVAVLAVVNHSLHRRTQELQQSLAASGRTIGELRHERDLLTAHVVLVETRMRETLAGVAPRPAEQRKDPRPPSAAEPLPGGEGAAGRSAESELGIPAVQPPLGMSDELSVEGFELKLSPKRNTLALRYKIVNASHGQRALTGTVVVVLKAEGVEPEQWLALPDVGLVRGRPVSTQKGYSFNIRHSKVFEHSAALAGDIPDYTHAVLYVFSKQGELLAAQERPIALKAGSP